METFKLKIVDSSRVFFDGECQCLTIPYIDGGEMAFLARHENCVVPIEAGEMKIKSEDGSVIDAFVGDGFLEFLDNEATIVCSSAQRPDEIDLDRAEKSKAHYEEVLRQHHSNIEYADYKAGLARAMERIKIKNKYK
ncbi:MAG: F0F1 ATP synthase subunit epsilon [Eubacterium sp.]|nr:F0F1 ATP synthase subunit epsilon [Eubacterium sp.]